MAHAQTLEAIILKTHDVGEADRFCILFTRERGKIAARAKGVRKPLSKKGGTLLAPHHVTVTVKESSAGYLITDTSHIKDYRNLQLGSYLYIQQGIEILLSLLHDEQPLPEVFDVICVFLAMSSSHGKNYVLPFTLRLLVILGLFPSLDSQRMSQFSEHEKRFALQSCNEQWEGLPKLSKNEKKHFSVLCAELLEDHTTRSLKAGAIVAEVLAL